LGLQRGLEGPNGPALDDLLGAIQQLFRWRGRKMPG
jgi:hypothetical protein